MSKTGWVVISAVILTASYQQYITAERERTAPPRTPEEIAAQAKQAAAEAKRPQQDNLAAIGAVALKKAMKDPDAFKLTSAIVMQDGTACYEYRAKNSFGASFPGYAVMLPSGKMIVNEQNENAYYAAFQKGCSGKSGRDIAKIIEISRVLN